MKKRALPRKLAGDGELYYSPEAIDRIIEGLNAKHVDRTWLERKLENSAERFVALAHGIAQHDEPPSRNAARWDVMLSRLNNFLHKFEVMPRHAEADLESAIEALAKRRGELPDIEPYTIVLPPVPGVPGTEGRTLPVWPVEKQIEKWRQSLEWLRQSIEEARSAAACEVGTGGNRPDDAKHQFCKALHRIAREVLGLEGELAVYTDRGTDEIVGPLPDYLEACFRPLGVRDSRAALVKTYRRALQT